MSKIVHMVEIYGYLLPIRLGFSSNSDTLVKVNLDIGNWTSIYISQYPTGTSINHVDS